MDDKRVKANYAEHYKSNKKEKKRKATAYNDSGTANFFSEDTLGRCEFHKK